MGHSTSWKAGRGVKGEELEGARPPIPVQGKQELMGMRSASGVSPQQGWAELSHHSCSASIPDVGLLPACLRWRRSPAALHHGWKSGCG